MRITLINYFVLLFMLNSCKSDGQTTNRHIEGEFDIKFQLQNTITGELGYNLPGKAWFRDSLLIEEVLMYNTNTIHNVTTFSTILLHYLFIDLRKGLIYKYKTFSDTAAIMDIYPVTDSGRKRRDYHKWYYNSAPSSYLSLESEGKDTLVDGVWYKRDIIWQQDRQYIYREIHLHRCDEKNKLFTLGNYGLSNDGCPLVKRIVYGVTGTYPYFTNELNYVSDSLTTGQRKVMDAWERNADCNATVPKLPYISPHPKPVRKYIDLTKKKK